MAEKKTNPVKVPQRPWKKGDQGDYTSFNITVRVAETQENVFSDHELESQEDHLIAKELRSGGLRQSAYALMTESIRKEILYTILVKLQDSPEHLKKYFESTPATKLQLESEMGNTIAQYFIQNVNINMIALVRECFENVALSSGATQKQQ